MTEYKPNIVKSSVSIPFARLLEDPKDMGDFYSISCIHDASMCGEEVRAVVYQTTINKSHSAVNIIPHLKKGRAINLNGVIRSIDSQVDKRTGNIYSKLVLGLYNIGFVPYVAPHNTKEEEEEEC